MTEVSEMLACVAVVSVSFKPSGAIARGHWAKRRKRVGAGAWGGGGRGLLACSSFLPSTAGNVKFGVQWVGNIGLTSDFFCSRW